VRVLIAAGADVNATFAGAHGETPLHWAATSDDVVVLDALLDADGSVIDGGAPLADAVAFGQWNAARRLLDRGATPNLWQAAALGQIRRVEERVAAPARPTVDEITNPFWCTCHGGQRQTAEYLLDHGADINWIGHDNLTPSMPPPAATRTTSPTGSKPAAASRPRSCAERDGQAGRNRRTVISWSTSAASHTEAWQSGSVRSAPRCGPSANRTAAAGAYGARAYLKARRHAATTGASGSRASENPAAPIPKAAPARSHSNYPTATEIALGAVSRPPGTRPA
jgi:hypothetical protein